MSQNCVPAISKRAAMSAVREISARQRLRHVDRPERVRRFQAGAISAAGTALPKR